MNSRDVILNAVMRNLPVWTDLPDDAPVDFEIVDSVEQFKRVLQSVGGAVYEITSMHEAIEIITNVFSTEKRLLSVCNGFEMVAESYIDDADAHLLEDVDVAIIDTHFAVAENGAVWITEKLVRERVLPFICQHLVAIVRREQIVPGMQQAYEKIGQEDYGFGVFIAGPSKTADIEQSLVLGAHGPKSMTVFII